MKRSSASRSADVTIWRSTSDAGSRPGLSRISNASRSALGIELDLVAGELIRRFTEQGDMDLPKLRSSVALHSDISPIEIGDSRLDFGSGDAWLLSLPELELWVAGIHGDKPSDVTLTTERGRRNFQGMTSGLIVWRGDEVTVTRTPPPPQPTSDNVR